MSAEIKTRIKWHTGHRTGRGFAYSWRMGDRRIEGKLRDNALVIKDLLLSGDPEHFIASLRSIIEYGRVGEQRIDWIYVEQINFRVANRLVAELQFRVEPGITVDCWRQADGLELPL
jgi:hypothetical protein